MSKGTVCKCPGTLAERMKNWKVLDFRCNHSAFNGYKETPSEYSCLKCEVCGMIWRTKSSYVDAVMQKVFWNK